MSLSRKRKKELKKLKKHANQLWQSQQELLAEAGGIAQNATAQIGNYSREHVVPAVRNTYETRIQPKVDSGARFVSSVRDRLENGIAPYDEKSIKRAKKAAQSVKKRVSPKKSSGPSAGSVIAIGAGVAAAAALIYAVWQTFRADDELWVAEDDSLFPNT